MVSISYPEIAHLIQDVQATPEEAHFHFISDCGKFEQTVTVARELAPESAAEVSQGTLSRWVKAALKRVLREASSQDRLTPGERETLSLRAFERVASALSRVDGRWLGLSGREHPGEFFERQLSVAPITETYDLEVLVRVLLEVSRSDSQWRREEKAFLEEVVQDHAMINRLQKAPNLTVSELAEVSSTEVKQTILMLAWAMAYADGSLDLQEMSRLTHLCRGFMLPEPRVRELQLAAKLSLLNRYLEAQKEHVPRDELRRRFDQKALDWGVCEQNLRRLRAWYPQDFPDDSSSSGPLTAEDDTNESLQSFYK